MKFNIGDKIRFLDQVGEGTITEILENNKLKIEDSDGFDYVVLGSEVIMVSDRGNEALQYDASLPSEEEIFEKNVDREQLKQAQDKFSDLYNDNTRVKKGDFMEVDLHIHQLLENTRGMQNGDMLEHQIRHFERMMKTAEQKKISKVVFIHGVGEGVLKREIKRLIEQFYPNCSSQDADYREYGYGATEIRIRFN